VFSALVWASDRIVRSVKNLLEILDELNRMGIEYVSIRENIDTAGPLGRANIVIVAAIAELERSLIVKQIATACGATSSMARKPDEIC
jgi:DNA invertase Pin-like site-specific DNA recombinase